MMGLFVLRLRFPKKSGWWWMKDRRRKPLSVALLAESREVFQEVRLEE
jgi:hypothetical protein